MARPCILLLVIGASTLLGEVRGYGYKWFNLPPPVVIAEDCVKTGEEGKSEGSPEKESSGEEPAKEEPKEEPKEPTAEGNPAEVSGETSEKTSEETKEEGEPPKVSYWSLFPPRNYVKSYYQPYVSSYAVAPNYGYSYGYTTGSAPYFYPSYGRMVLLPNTWSPKGSSTLRYISF